MTYLKSSALIETDWLEAHLAAPDVRVVDASYYLPGQEGDARADYDGAHIPGAQFFDIDDISDTENPLPHMLPSPEKFASRVRKLGLGDGMRIVVYDSRGMMFASRAWWMFRVFGHEDVAILNGGLPKWRLENRPIEDRPPIAGQRHFTARLNNFLVRDLDQIRVNLTSKSAQIVDARSAGRFAGTEPEIRPGMRPGHIPGSLNLPYTQLLDPDSGTLLPADKLAGAFDTAGIDLERPIVTTCGSGISAAVLAFGLYLLGRDDVAVYDGSWSEWGHREDTPVEV